MPSHFSPPFDAERRRLGEDKLAIGRCFAVHAQRPGVEGTGRDSTKVRFSPLVLNREARSLTPASRGEFLFVAHEKSDWSAYRTQVSEVRDSRVAFHGQFVDC